MRGRRRGRILVEWWGRSAVVGGREIEKSVDKCGEEMWHSLEVKNARKMLGAQR